MLEVHWEDYKRTYSRLAKGLDRLLGSAYYGSRGWMPWQSTLTFLKQLGSFTIALLFVSLGVESENRRLWLLLVSAIRVKELL